MKKITAVNLEVGKAIHDGLVRNHLTQEQLADKVGSTQRSISSYVTGKTQPPLDMLANICKILKINLNQVLGLPEFHYPNRVIRDQDERAYMALYDGISVHKKKEFIDIVGKLKDFRNN